MVSRIPKTNQAKGKEMKKLVMMVAVVAAMGSAQFVRADAQTCGTSIAKAASDCIKGSNKECKAGIDKVVKDCGGKSDTKGGGKK